MSVHVEYERVDWLAGQVTTALDTLDSGRTTLRDAPGVADSAFGDSGDASACGGKYRSLVETSIDALAELVGALEADREKMRRMVETYRDTDQATADRIWAQAGTHMDVYSAHVHSHDDGLSRSEDEAIRADQTGRLADITGDYEGAAVVGADLNMETGRDRPSSEAIDGFADEGFTSIYDAGASPDEREIDHVLGSPNVVSGDSSIVETDGLSDHDGQHTELEAPRW